MTLPLDSAPDANTAGSLSAIIFFVGYLLAALAPVGIGAARELSGGFALPFATMAAIGAVMLATALASFGPRRLMERPRSSNGTNQ